jgi:hypothetical protein
MDYVETNTVVTDLVVNGTVETYVKGVGVVDWGDGGSSPYDSEGEIVRVVHTYTSLRTYTVKFSGKLTVLALGGNEGTSEGSLKSTYLKLLQCPNLLALSTTGVTSITGLEKCTKLTSLGLNDSNIKVLNLSRNTQLLQLDMLDCQIEELQGLTSLTKLVIVEIRYTSVQNLVPDFTFASDLNYLELRDLGISSLLVPESTNQIDIRFNEFTLEGLNALATLLNSFGSKPYSSLNLYGNPGTPEVNLENEPWSTLVNNGWNVTLVETLNK